MGELSHLNVYYTMAKGQVYYIGTLVHEERYKRQELAFNLMIRFHKMKSPNSEKSSRTVRLLFKHTLLHNSNYKIQDFKQNINMFNL